MHVNEEVVNRMEGLLAAEEGAPAPEQKPDSTVEVTNKEEAGSPPTQWNEPTKTAENPPPKPEDEADAVRQTQEETEQEKTPETTEEIVATSIGDLAAYLTQQGVNVEAADLYNLKLPVTNAKGEREEITIGQWKDGYQSSIKARADAERSIGETRNVMQQLQAEQQRMHSQLNELAALATADEARLGEEAKAVNWNELRQDDPAEYAVRRQEFEDRNRDIQRRKQRISAYVNQQQQVNAQKMSQRKAEMLQREASILPQAIPEWRDQAVAEKERSEMVQYLSTIGYQPQEVDGIVDHRAVVLMRKAMLFDKQQKANPEAKKVLKIGAKVIKPGPSRSKQQLENDSYRDDLNRFRKSGGRDENLAVDLVEKHLLGEI